MNVLVQRLVWGRPRSNLYIECRRCGTTLSSAATPCSACGSDRTVTYDVA